MREGQIAVIPTSRGASVVQLLQAQEASLSEQQATPIIERYLHSRLAGAFRSRNAMNCRYQSAGIPGYATGVEWARLETPNLIERHSS